MLNIRIVHIMIIGMIAISTIYAVQSYVTFQINAEQLIGSVAIKNEAIATNMIQRQDLFLDKRIEEFKALARTIEVQQILKSSNEQFAQIENINDFMEEKREYENYSRYLPLITQAVEEKHSDDLISVINSFDHEFGFNYADEFFITNAYGANIVLIIGKAEYDQRNNDWWKNVKSQDTQIGSIQYNEDYNIYSVPITIGIYDEDKTFLGAIHVLIDAQKLISEFAINAKILENQNKQALLLDSDGRIIYSGHMVFDQGNYTDYNQKIVGQVGHFLLGESQEKTIVSFAKSDNSDSNGMGWTVTVLEKESSIVESLSGVINSVFLPSLVGTITIVIIGITITIFVSRPLHKLALLSEKLAKGNFNVKADPSKIQEIKTISDSFNNLTESLKRLVETEKELAESKIKIRNERLSAIGELAASMAHDLKNPLAVIKTASDTLKKKFGKQDKRIDRLFYNMDDAVARMSHQIKDVLDYVRTTPLEICDANLNKIIHDSVASIAVPENITVSMPKNDLTIKCDIRKMEVVFINLILNAIQAIGEEKKGNISILTDKDNNQNIVIQVQNSGDRIPEDLISKIFEPLVTTKYQGTGLGLSTCKNIIKQHGGTISATNDPTTFTITLPKDLDKT